jgi:hypothetical protein
MNIEGVRISLLEHSMTTLHTVHCFCGGSSRRGMWCTPKFRRVKMDLMVALLNKTDIVSLIVKMKIEDCMDIRLYDYHKCTHSSTIPCSLEPLLHITLPDSKHM